MVSKKDNTRSPLIGAKNILYMFIDGQTHFGMPGYAKTSLTLSRTNLVALYSDSNTTSEHAPQVEKNILICMQNNQLKSQATNFIQKFPLS